METLTGGFAGLSGMKQECARQRRMFCSATILSPHLPGGALSTLRVVTHSDLTTNPGSRYYYFPPFKDEAMKVREVSDLPKESGGPGTPQPRPQPPCCPVHGAQVSRLEPLSHSTCPLTFGELLALQCHIHQVGTLPDSPTPWAAGRNT